MFATAEVEFRLKVNKLTIAIIWYLLFNLPRVRMASLGGACLPRFGTGTATGTVHALLADRVKEDSLYW